MVTPIATIPLTELVALVEPLALEPETSRRLVQGALSIMQVYLGRLMTDEVKADHASSLKQLAAIERESLKLADRLGELDSRYLVLLEEKRHDPGSDAEVALFDLLQLERKLSRLSRATARARAELKPRGRGAPPRHRLDAAMSEYRKLFEGLNIDVVLRESGSRQARRSLEGVGGNLLVAIFAKFDPHQGEPELWGSWRRTDPASS